VTVEGEPWLCTSSFVNYQRVTFALANALVEPIGANNRNYTLFSHVIIEVLMAANCALDATVVVYNCLVCDADGKILSNRCKV